jgi:AAA family ATP:ADP antiporter
VTAVAEPSPASSPPAMPPSAARPVPRGDAGNPARPVMAIVAGGTLAMAGYEMVRSASASVFLAHHSAARLPEALMLVPLAMFAFTWLFSVSLKHLGPARTFIATLLLSALILAASATAVLQGIPGAPFLLYIFGQAYIVFIVEEVWAFINSLFVPAQGKRWNGVIIAVSTAGSITGGLVTGRLSVAFGSERLVWLASGLTAAASLLGWLAFRLAGKRPAPPDRPPVKLADHFAWDLLRTGPTIRRLALMVVAAQSVAVLLDIAFHQALQAAVPLQDPRTALLGYFWSAVNLFALALQLGLCPLLLSRVPLRRIHAGIPLLFGLAALGAVAFPVLPVLAAVFFISKTVDYSVFRAAKEVLYIPLSFTARYRAKMTVDALIYRSSKGVVSVLLTISGRVFGFLPLRLYPLLVVFLSGAWNRFTRGLPEPPASPKTG